MYELRSEQLGTGSGGRGVLNRKKFEHVHVTGGHHVVKGGWRPKRTSLNRCDHMGTPVKIKRRLCFSIHYGGNRPSSLVEWICIGYFVFSLDWRSWDNMQLQTESMPATVSPTMPGTPALTTAQDINHHETTTTSTYGTTTAPQR